VGTGCGFKFFKDKIRSRFQALKINIFKVQVSGETAQVVRHILDALTSSLIPTLEPSNLRTMKAPPKTIILKSSQGGALSHTSDGAIILDLKQGNNH
jgi:hypothetical protein